MEAWLAEGKTIWVLCQIGMGILVTIKIGIGWAILLEIVATFLIYGAVEVWKPEVLPRYRYIDSDAYVFASKISSKRYTKAQLNKDAYDILAKYVDRQLVDDPKKFSDHSPGIRVF